MRTLLSLLIMITSAGLVMAQPSYEYSWKYYTTGTTGILGDNAEAIWIDHDGDPYIAAYTPGWEEGGFSKFVQQENRWINYSNVTYPVIGSIYDVGSSRISDIEEDGTGMLWMATWRGILKFDPAAGGSSLEFWGAGNSLHPGGRTRDIDVAPDGTVWAAIISVDWGFGGLVQFDPSNGQWRYWGYGITSNNWPALIGQCDHLSIQAEPGGGYMVWIDGEGWNTMITFDSDTQLFTLLPQNNLPGEVLALPGNDCVDDSGNLWALRFTTPGNPFSLGYRKPDGTWVTPAQPASVVNDIWVFKAIGNQEALITGLSNEVFHFDGSSWQSKGIWRDGAYSYALDMDATGAIWVSGMEGAAKRNPLTGNWQRYRITNTAQMDYFIEDIDIDAQGRVWTTANAGPGVGGFQMFDGANWTGFNEFTYGLGYPFPFPTDNTEAICYRPSNGSIVVNPMFNNLHSWNGSNYNSLNYPAVRSKGLVEDSQQRLWSLGEYYDLSYLNPTTGAWVPVPFVGSGANLRKDPELEGTVWACSGHEVLRTDGTSRFVRSLADFPELDPQSDVFSTVIPAPGGIAWLGSNRGLFKLDASAGTYQFFSTGNSDLPGEQITPLGVSADGLLWFTNFGSVDTTRIGLGWFDGTNFGILPVEEGGLPHAQISDMEIQPNPNGYALWMSCISRGLAVLHVNTTQVGIGSLANTSRDLSLASSPNPFNLETAISFTMGNDGQAGITIFDLQGRPVRDFGRISGKKGANRLTWDGNDNQGRRIGRGAYICRLTCDHLSESMLIMVD